MKAVSYRIINGKNFYMMDDYFALDVDVVQFIKKHVFFGWIMEARSKYRRTIKHLITRLVPHYKETC